MIPGRKIHSALLLSAVAVPLLVALLTRNSIIVGVKLVPCPMDSSRPSIPGPTIEGLSVEITSLEDCSFNLPTGVDVPIAGTYSGDLSGWEIWVLLYASDEKYYLQQPPKLSPENRGHWTGTLVDTTHETLDVVVVVANENSEASQKFRGWIEDGGIGGGYSVLPQGLTEMDAITVSTHKLR